MNRSSHPMRVAIVYNDDADQVGERDRAAVAGASLQSAAIARALESRGHFAVAIPVRSDPIEVAVAVRAARAEVVFNACEGFSGRTRAEGAFAGFLELLGLPFTGNRAATLFLAQDKERSKAVLAAAGVPVARGAALEDASAPLPSGLSYPLFVKTRFEDASHGITAANLCADEPALRRRAGELIETYRGDALVEEFLPGRELNVALLGNGVVDVLPIGEIDYEKLAGGRPRIITYEAKWCPESPEYRGTPVICPAALEEPLKLEVERIARAAFRALGCSGYARVDLRLDRDGRPVVLEVNPNPDISPDAGFARSAARAGIEYEELIERIVRVALPSQAGAV